MNVHILDGGEMACTDGSFLSSQYDQGSHIALANPVFLIEHPKGRVLWDTGLADGLHTEKDGVENWIFKLKVNQPLLKQLSDLELRPADIDYLAFSHMHIDHTGNANYFPHSTIIMQEAEYAHAFAAASKPMNYADYEGLSDSTFMKLDGDYDLFGDGLITFIATPGHTPGHQSLMLRLQDTTIIISGDVSYTQHHFYSEGIPIFNTDPEASKQSIAKIRRWLADHDAQLWIQHDVEHYASRKAKNRYNERITGK